jgi:hypothetical protein
MNIRTFICLLLLACLAGCFGKTKTPTLPSGLPASELHDILPPSPDAAAKARADADAAVAWPRLLTAADGTTFTVYNPQLDSWEGLVLSAHAAVAAKRPADKQPVYGLVNLTARTIVDRDAREVTFDDLQVVDANFPAEADGGVAFRDALRTAIPRNVRTVPLDHLEAQLAISTAQVKREALPLSNDPPKILFAAKPSILVYIDGEPKVVPVRGTKLARVINTRVLLLRGPGGVLYLHVFDGYLQATALTGPWTVAQQLPPEAEAAEGAVKALRQVDLLEGVEDPKTKQKPKLATGPVPDVVVATVPTELIVTAGEPKYTPIEGTKLLYVSNTSANMFRHLEDQKVYLLISGRWYRAAGESGPWEFVPASLLPKDFAQIPDDSPKENVKASVPGTRQAQEAAIASTIPTTTKIERQAAKLRVTIDGTPDIRPIKGTQLNYVYNASLPIIEVDSEHWYACQDGVWFVGPASTGPWAVSDSVPAEIYAIPPSSPLHYVTYARVYSSDNRAVYVGYTPGYYGVIVSSDGTVVYGTGYPYSPWIGNYWYGPPMTYGMGAAMVWTPWGGWGYGYGFGWAWGYPWYPVAPWWGPYYGAVYNARGGVTAWGPGGWAGTTGNLYSQRGNFDIAQRGAAGYNAFGGNQWAARYGQAYNSSTGTLITGQQGAVQNVYSGDYAKFAGGTIENAEKGISAQGGKVTVGNQNTGQSATVAKAEISGPDGRDVTISGVQTDRGEAAVIRGDQGGVAKIGDDMFAGKDGNVYRHNSDGGWSQVNLPNNTSGPAAADRTQQLNQQFQARNMGTERANSFRASRPAGGFRGR